MKGQGVIEYALFLVLVAVIVIAVMAFFATIITDQKYEKYEHCVDVQERDKEWCAVKWGK